MPPLTQITPEDIERLNPAQLVSLLRTLLHAEAQAHCVNRHGIHVPYQITVADGGNDGEWDAETAPCEYIPANLTIYQCKATGLSATECGNEVLASNGSVKTQVTRALDGGAFVFFCRKGYVTEGIDERITATRQALRNAGRTTWSTDQIHFLDGNKISDWTNRHPGAAAYVCECVHRWQPTHAINFRSWEAFPENQTEFQSNDQLIRIVRDLRSAVSEPRSTARLTGHSGLGKTRIAFEVFNFVADDASNQEKLAAESLQQAVVYFDLATSERGLLAELKQLALTGYSGVMIVDNCPREAHNQLVQAVKHPNCQLSLLTLDYVPEASQGDSQEVLLLPDMMKDIVPKILNAIPGLRDRLTEAGIQRVAEFAQGFPQIAILTAEAGQALDLEALHLQGRIADRLLWGRENPDPAAKRALRCMALFTAIGHADDHSQQLTFVRQTLCNGIDEEEFNNRIGRFRRKRIIQNVGNFCMVTPPPLAVALAADWLDDNTDERVLEILPLLEEVGLTDYFCSRLKQLDFSERAQELSARLTRPGGPFDSAEVLNSEVGSRVFRSLSEINPLAAVDCLTRVFGTMSPEQAEVMTDGRRNLVWALEKLAWDADLFRRAARVLLTFAAGENEHWSNNATGVFRRLYHLHLSGTRCPALSRLPTLREGLALQNPEVRDVCIRALGSALTWDRFSRSSGPEQRGTRPPEKDWSPETWADIWDYWREVYTMLGTVIRDSSDPLLSSRAAEALGGNLGPLLTCPLVTELDADFRDLCHHQGNQWPEARDELKRILSYQKNLTDEYRAHIQRWLGYLEPSDLPGRLADVVAKPGWHTEEQPEGGFKNLAAEAAENLADELYDSGEEWLPHVSVLLQGDQQETWAFGSRVMQRDENPRELFDQCVEAYRTLDPSARNSQLLRGMINAVAGTPVSTEIFDSVAGDPELRGDLLLPLSTAATSCVDDLRRVTDLVQAGDLPDDAISHFSMGGISKQFDGDQFNAILTDLVTSRPTTTPAALQLASAFYHRDPERFSTVQGLVVALVLSPSILERISEPMMGHNWEEAVNHLLNEPPEGFVVNLADVLAAHAANQDYISVFDLRVMVLAIRRLLREHWQSTWPCFERAMRDENGSLRYPLVDLLCQEGTLTDAGVPLWDLPVEEFRAWAARNPDLIPYIVHHIPLYTVETVEPTGEQSQTPDPEERDSPSPQPVDDALGVPKPDQRYVWHPLAKAVVELCGRDDLLGCLTANVFTFSSTGSRVPYLKNRRQLVADLADGADPELTGIANTVIARLDREIEDEKKRDAQHAAGIYEL